jgi:hypothetical protein
MTIFYLDYENGSDANDGSDWANAWKTITSGATAARIAPGDIIRIAKSPAPASIGNATWTDLSKTVTLAGAQTLTVDLCETAWTPGADTDVTVARTAVATDGKQGSYSMKFTADAAPKAATLQAYYPLAGATDFSSYQKLSFWLKNEAAIADADTWLICLCSDAVGAVVVDTFAVPAIPSTARWLPLTIARAGGGNLGNSIQSIALYTGGTAPAASKYIYVDDFIACTTSGLNLQSLISKNSLEQGGTEGWYGIQSIDGVTVLLDNDTNTKGNAGRGYSGTTETVATYKRETIKTALAASVSTQVQAIQDSGVSGSNIEFQGGYNTATTVQDGETFFDGLNGHGYGLYLASKSYITLNYISVCRYNYGVYFSSSSSNNTITTLSNANNNTNSGVYFSSSSSNNTITTLSNANNNTTYGVYFSGNSNNTITTLSNANNNTNSGVYFSSSSSNNTITTLSNANNNTNIGVYFSGSSNNTIRTLSTTGNIIGGISTAAGSVNYVYNATIAEATKVSGFTAYANGRLFVQKYGGDINDNRIFDYGEQSDANGLMYSQTTTRYVASGLAWCFAPGSDRISIHPAQLPIAKIACEANKQIVFKAWMKKDHSINIACGIRIVGGQIAGVAADLTDTKADDTDWEQLSISFTPTESGVVEVLAESWYVAGNSNAYVHEVSVDRGNNIEVNNLGSVADGVPYAMFYYGNTSPKTLNAKMLVTR